MEVIPWKILEKLVWNETRGGGALRRLVAPPVTTFFFQNVPCHCIWPPQQGMAPMTSPLVPFSGARAGHHELRRDQGAARAHHVVAAWPVTEEERRGKHLHQKPWQIHRQQGSVRHVLRVWKHPLMQGITDKAPQPPNVMFEVAAQFADRHKCKNKKFSSISICPWTKQLSLIGCAFFTLQ